MQKQKTIKNQFSVKGVGLHTGCQVNLLLKPAEENAGIKFIRTDLPEKPVIKADLSNVKNDSNIPRCTTLGVDGVNIYTIEHFMSVMAGMEITNIIVEMDAEELPGLDGSGADFLKMIKDIGVVEQNAELEPFEIKEPIGVEDNGSSIYVFPSNEFKISYTLDYEYPELKSQFYSTVINNKNFEDEIVKCRTFCVESSANELKKQGFGKGANYNNTLVVGEKGVIKNKVRFSDEFARHKVLDFIGDMYLLGMPVRGHFFAVKSGHSLNIKLLKKIYKQKKEYEKKSVLSISEFSDKKEIDISGIMRILPHRYPFLLVDRVVEIEKGKKGIGLKNVTINDGFFRGHFPQKPVMPGVLMVEAMAQTAGVVILTNEAHHGKLAFFMAIDNVKFRKIVSPGDQLIMEVEVIKDKSRIAQVRGCSKVLGEIVAEADMMFSFTDGSYLNS